MRIKAQLAMVMNLDKCIGCHTCSIPCKNVWTSRKGAEYIWYNNVETKPGTGYPRRWEDQSHWRGGWLPGHGGPTLRAGGRLAKLAEIFHNPDLPRIDDYYEPWTYDYGKLTDAGPGPVQPAARSESVLTGERMAIKWGPNWEDDLAGVYASGQEDVNLSGLDHKALLAFRRVFMFHLPRICEHCLNPACLASCPSGAIYKRDEDGIVLVDQTKCRSWRFCVSGCPYKKTYFNWADYRAEKCIFCYPRTEAGLPTLCAETCVGRIRYIGVVLYDVDRLAAAAATPEDRDVYRAHLDLLLDPSAPEVAAEAAAAGLPDSVLDAARRSPVYDLAVRWRLALPLHPEFRTLPMVWYVPPLSPLLDGRDDPAELAAANRLRIPVRYLANLLTAGDEVPVALALRRLMALRAYMRSKRVDQAPATRVLDEAGLTPESAEALYRLLALAEYRERYVIPKARGEAVADPLGAMGRRGFPEEGGEA